MRRAGSMRCIIGLFLSASCVIFISPSIALALGSISGTVTVGGSPLQSVNVFVYDQNEKEVGLGYTDASGVYRTGGLPTGNCKVWFQDFSGVYLGEWYNNASSFDTATSVSVIESSTTTGIDASLSLGGSISGTVTAGGDPLQGVGVAVLDQDGNIIKSTYTDANGYYILGGLYTGHYKVGFREPSGDYADELYNDAYSINTATFVSVSAGSITTGIDAALGLPGNIAGLVSASDGGDLGPRISVFVYDVDQNFITSASTDVSKAYQYETPSLRPGSYIVKFMGDSNTYYTGEYYDNKQDIASANLVAVTSGTTTPNINAQLDPGGKISGAVIASDGGDLGLTVSILVYDTDQNFITSASTDVSKAYQYETPSLRPGSYIVKFMGDSSTYYTGEYYDNKQDIASANLVAVTSGTTTTNINAQLDPGGKISGAVSASDDGDLGPTVSILVYDTDRNFITSASADVSQAYHYETPSLRPGSYIVKFMGDSSTYYTDEYYDNKQVIASANLVAVTSGTTTTNINAQLDPGGKISGAVSASDDGDLGPTVSILVYDTDRNFITSASADVSQAYHYETPSLRPGSYIVKFWASTYYTDEYYDNKRVIASVDLVVVTSGATTPNINAQLEPGGKVAVAVRNDFDGDGRSDIGCYYPAGGNWYGFNSTKGFWQTQFGYDGTLPIIGDFDGDGKADFGCYYPTGGNWYVYKSTEGFWQTTFGYEGTIPVVGDFDGDGRDDIGCYYATGGNWYVYKSTEGFWQTTFGYEGTIPVVGDFDGDGRDDIGCYYPAGGNWYVYKSTEGFWQTTFGYEGTEPVVGDFDGDGRDDIGCYYPTGGKWYLFKSSEGFWQTTFGYSGTIPLGGTLR